MRKGKFGVVLALYAVAAYMLAAFNESLIALLGITLFVIAVEKDEWASKQCLQALGICSLRWMISKAVYFVKLPFSWIDSYVEYDSGYHKFFNIYSNIFGYVTEILFIIIFILLISAVLKAAKQQDAKLPIVSAFADWAFGVVAPKAPTPAAPVQNAAPTPAAPVQNVAPTPAAPVQNAAPTPAAPVSNVAPAQPKVCPKCGAPVEGKFCGKCGTQI